MGESSSGKPSRKLNEEEDRSPQAIPTTTPEKRKKIPLTTNPRMPKFSLQLRAELENVTALKPKDDDYEWSFKVKCASCHEANDGCVTFNGVDQVDIPRSRGTANFVMKCKFCSQEGNASIVEKSLKPYDADDSGQWKTVLTIESRGLEFVGWEPTHGQDLVCRGVDSNAEFTLDFEDDESTWVGYDEVSACPVGVSDIEGKFIKAK
ncbi:hypothetical protein HDU67_005832 [Dinochytrium kinnereticum]|nr:hypothetical protein HDU67_005832 [Dinochytrium kinnereticum]